MNTAKQRLKDDLHFQAMVISGASIDWIHKEIGGEQTASRSTVARAKRELMQEWEADAEEIAKEYGTPQPDCDLIAVFDEPDGCGIGEDDIEIEVFCPEDDSSAPEEKPAPKAKELLIGAQLNPPVEHPMPDPEKDALKRENALLREQLTWAQRASSMQRSGGKLTLLRSDNHWGDRTHMVRCYQQMEDKTLVVLSQYQPEEIVILENGDSIAGRGIYRNQNMDATLQTTEDQVMMGAYKLYLFDQRIKAQHPGVPVKWRATIGNHDRNMGEPTMPYLVMIARSLGVNITFAGDAVIENLASAGVYNLYAEHGYGYSGISPSSPKWIADMAEKLLVLSRDYFGVNRIRRVSHGHTHWFQVGMERLLDVFYDTTGGCQRNERVLLGKNSRPMGWIAYVSPSEFDGILDPIGIQPDTETIIEELRDPYLFSRNAADSGEALANCHQLLDQLGVRRELQPLGR